MKLKTPKKTDREKDTLISSQSPEKKISKKSRKTNRTLEIARDIFLTTLWAFVSVIASQYIIGYPLLWILGSDTYAEPVWRLINSVLVYALALFLLFYVPGKIRKKYQTTRAEAGLSNLPTWSDILLSIIGFIVATLFSALLVNAFSLFPWFDASETQNTGFSTYIFGVDRALAFITTVIVAPIAEEIIFRGWLYGKLRGLMHQKIPEWAGILISCLVVSIIFGLIHFQWNVAVNVFALSAVLCALREITGTIYSGILVHMIKNGIAFYIVYVAGLI